MRFLSRRVPFAAALFIFTVALPASAAETAAPIRLEVDAREAPRKILHAKLVIPAAPGPLTLLYPKWLPGEHGPTGPIADLAGLKITAAGRAVPWTRDPVEMYAFHCDVPAGASSLEVALDYLAPANSGGFSSAASTTTQLAVISWNQVLVYPKGASSDAIQFSPSLRLPAGWSHATALDPEGGAGGAGGDLLRFATVSLTTLVDSPVLAGAHFRSIPLAANHRIDFAADGEPALAMDDRTLAACKNLVAETGSLFGTRHYRHYDFLLTLSDLVAHFGLEHHESSDDRVAERSLVDDAKRKTNLSDLLSHEMVHSWNGKHRRPAGLMPGRFDEPMHGELLWVYEGLTQYLGDILAARAAFVTDEEYREMMAITAAEMEATRGRSWRPLADTAVAAQVLYEARPDWALYRRGVDYYPESNLLWLEADALIRRESGGRKSLDDFCKLFFGGRGGAPSVIPYTADDVFAALNQIQPHDWKRFWTERLQATETSRPLPGLAAAGWKLAWSDPPGEMMRAREDAGKTTDARFSIGILVNDDGDIPDIVPESPAAKAGIGPGMRLVAVNGRRWSHDVLREAIRATPKQPIEVLVENGDYYRSYKIDYTGGERFPKLERDGSKPDLLARIIAPLSSAAPAPGKK